MELFPFHLRVGMLFSEPNYKHVFFSGSTFNNPNHVIKFTTPLITLRGNSTTSRASLRIRQQYNPHAQIISNDQRHHTSTHLMTYHICIICAYHLVGTKISVGMTNTVINDSATWKAQITYIASSKPWFRGSRDRDYWICGLLTPSLDALH